MNLIFRDPKLLLQKSVKRINRYARELNAIYLEKIGKPPYPSLVSLPIIAQCNYRCGFCEINGVDRHLKEIGQRYERNQMTVDQVFQFRDVISCATSIDFGGLTALGEPLLSADFLEIIKSIRSINPNATLLLTTNGYLLGPDIADFLLANAPVSVTFSLHAATDEVYARIMGKGFDKVIKNIRFFCEKASRMNNVDTAINFGVGKFNYMETEKIVQLANDLDIKSLCMYPYYKSPNEFMEDVSLYGDPDLANHSLDAAYKLAKELGQGMVPPEPAYIHPETKTTKTSSELTYTGGCLMPYRNMIMKSVPMAKNKISLAVCNRIVLFALDLEKGITPQDIKWAWHHPALIALRIKPGSKNIPSICKFCQNPDTGRLRSLNHDEYKQQRDRAVKIHLARWQKNKISPSGSIELLEENIFSL